jgi:hypothetical protein
LSRQNLRAIFIGMRVKTFITLIEVLMQDYLMRVKYASKIREELEDAQTEPYDSMLIIGDLICEGNTILYKLKFNKCTIKGDVKFSDCTFVEELSFIDEGVGLAPDFSHLERNFENY